MYVGRGKFRILGQCYPYSGPIYWNEKQSRAGDIQVGEWISGLAIFYDNRGFLDLNHTNARIVFSHSPGLSFPQVTDTWVIESDTLAVKLLDSDFYQSNSCDIPTEISWFFNASRLLVADEIKIFAFLESEKYECRVKKLNPNQMSCIFDSKLGNIVSLFMDRGEKGIKPE